MAMPETTQKSLNFDTTIERAGRNEKSSQTDSAKPVGAWAGSQPFDSQGRTIWIVDAHRNDGRRFIVHVDEKLSAFVELERQVLTVTFYLESIHSNSCR